MVIQSSKSKYELMEDLGLLVNEEIKNDFDNLRAKTINEEKIIDALKKGINNESVMMNLSSVRGIALGLTEDCNFRCKYCIYSGDYMYARAHSSKQMDCQTAVKAVDFFLEMINNTFRTRKMNNFDIGFYGGEPLLRFDLLEKVIRGTKEKKWDNGLAGKFKIDFRITTNGYLLNEKIIDFLAENDVYVDISLDGPEVEHDRFRKHRNGSKTWAAVMTNIKKILEKHPEYYRDRVSYQCTIHPLHDLGKIEHYFKNSNDLFDINKIRFSRVSRQFLKEDIAIRDESAAPERGGLITKSIIESSIAGKFNLRNINYQKKLTGSCFPGGEKVFIDTDGKFHICEKMNPYFPIGDIEYGFDIDRIKSIIKQYNEEVIKSRCWQCEVWFLCGVCFVHAAIERELKIECDEIRKGYIALIKNFLYNRI